MGSIRIGNVFDDTQVQPLGGGRYMGEIPESWKVFFAQGGVSMMCALRAAQREVDRDDLELVSANAIYLRPMPCATYEVRVTVLRSGRAAAQVAADLYLRETDEHILRVHAVFGAGGKIPLPDIDRSFPDDVVHSETYVTVDDIPQDFPLAPFWRAMPFVHQFEFARALGKLAWDPDFGGDHPRIATWLRLRKTPRDARGRLDPIAYCMLGDNQDSYFQLTGLEALVRKLPTLQLDVQWFDTTEDDNLLQHARTTHAGRGYLHTEVELWSSERKLLAVVSQRGQIR